MQRQRFSLVSSPSVRVRAASISADDGVWALRIGFATLHRTRVVAKPRGGKESLRHLGFLRGAPARHRSTDILVSRQEAQQKPKNRGEKERAYGTPDSHVVPHRSTDEACSGLTAQFGRDTVCYTEYGRRHGTTHVIECIFPEAPA